MESIAMPVQPQRIRRYRRRYSTGNLLIGLAWNVLGFSYAFSDHSALHLFDGGFWICGGLAYIWSFSAIYWELRPDGLLEYQRGSARVISYDDISKVASSSRGGRVIEISFSQIPGVFPLTTMEVSVGHPNDFLADLRRLAPAAEFRI